MSFNLSDFYDENDMLKALDEVDTGKFWRPNKDRTVLRILPPIKSNGERLFYFTHKVHWINKVPYECLNQTLVDKDGNEHVATNCPICNLAKQLYKAGENDKEALDEAKAISAKTKDIARIIVRDDKDFKVQFYELPMSVKKLIISAISSGDYGSPVIHPIDGNDFVLQRTGTGQQTKYDTSYVMPKKSAISDSKEEIIKVLQDAGKITYNSAITFQTFESLNKVLREYAGRSSQSNETANSEDRITPQQNKQKPVETRVPARQEVSVTEDESEDELDSLLNELGDFDDSQIPF